MRRLTILLTFVMLCLPVSMNTADAQGKKARKSKRSKAKNSKKAKGPKNQENKVFDITGMDLSGQMRTPQLLYFLDRANEELERASLERRSFIPEMVRSLDEEAL